jgi:two-component system phosphate regulon response regulator PhoB
MARILLIEDNVELCGALVKILQPTHDIAVVHNVMDAKNAVERDCYDLFLMDLGLPDGNGFQLCSHFRSYSSTRETPILVLSGNDHSDARVTAFDLGADDFVPKPFQKEELMARVRARLRSAIKNTFGPFVIDSRSHRMFIREGDQTRDLNLTPFEYRLLNFFMQKPGQAISREQLIKECAGAEHDISDRTIDLHVCSLRKKIGKQYNYIRTVYGTGYIFQLDSNTNKTA